jgi:hypothetical protein
LLLRDPLMLDSAHMQCICQIVLLLERLWL